MAKFYFDLSDGKEIPAPEGESCECIDDAVRLATQFAKSIATARPALAEAGFWIAVRDESSAEVFRVRVGGY